MMWEGTRMAALHSQAALPLSCPGLISASGDGQLLHWAHFTLPFGLRSLGVVKALQTPHAHRHLAWDHGAPLTQG